MEDSRVSSFGFVAFSGRLSICFRALRTIFRREVIFFLGGLSVNGEITLFFSLLDAMLCFVFEGLLTGDFLVGSVIVKLVLEAFGFRG